MDKFEVLLQHAGDLGLDVRWALDLPEDIHGYYEDDARAAYLNHYCTQAQVVGALAHEVGHCIFGDRCSTEAIERRADEMGASLIITRAEYAEAEEAVGCHAGALARHMGVTRDLVLAWRGWWFRVGHREAA